MAQRISFNFSSNDVGVMNLRLENNQTYFDSTIVFTNTPGVVGDNIVYGTTTLEFASKFAIVIRKLLSNFDINAFYYKVIELGTLNIDIITGSSNTSDRVFINNNLLNTQSIDVGPCEITKSQYNTNNLLLSWKGATDNIGISGYEISYKLKTSTFWVTTPFIINSSSNGVSEIVTNSTRRDYDIRIRTKDTSGQFSSYKTIRTIPPATRNETGAYALIPGDSSFCSQETIILFYIVGNIAYDDVGTSIVFNGGDKYWLISNPLKYTAKISSLGVISSTGTCLISNSSYRSKNSVSVLNQQVCSTACTVLVYYIGNIAVNTILYSDSMLTQLFSTGSQINVNYLIDDEYICLINNVGKIISITYKSSICTYVPPGGGSGNGYNNGYGIV